MDASRCRYPPLCSSDELVLRLSKLTPYFEAVGRVTQAYPPILRPQAGLQQAYPPILRPQAGLQLAYPPILRPWAGLQ